MKKTMSILTMTGLMSLSLAACGSSGSSGSSGGGGGGGGGGSTVTIGYQNNGSVDPAQAALSLGLYQKYIQGKVKLVEFASGPASLTALGSGDVDIMTGIGNPPVASAIANKVPVSVVWAEELGQTDQALVVKKNSGIKSVKDLQGKQVATVVGSTSGMALSAVLKKNGVDSGKVTARNMDPQTMRTAWTKNQISAAYIWYPVLGKILADGGTQLSTDGDVADVAPIFNFSVVNKSWAAKHPKTVQQFIQAQDAGLKALQKDPTATLQKMIKDTHETMPEAMAAVKTTKSFSAAQQLQPDALGPDDSHSLARTSLLAASKYLHAVDSSGQVLKAGDISIDRSFVKDYLKAQSGS